MRAGEEEEEVEEATEVEEEEEERRPCRARDDSSDSLVIYKNNRGVDTWGWGTGWDSPIMTPASLV